MTIKDILDNNRRIEIKNLKSAYDKNNNLVNILKNNGFKRWKKLYDGTYEVWGDLIENPNNLPVKIKILHGNFQCTIPYLESLNGCPEIIYGNFGCDNNKLKNLKGGPKIVKGNYNCEENELESLEGSPKEIGGNFICNNNYKNLKTLKG